LEGSIWDVALDLRKGSPTFLEWYGIELSAENKLQLLIPKGFAHGFSVLSDTATVLYKCDELYHPESEAGVQYIDNQLNIDWKIPKDKEIISKKDQLLPELAEAVHNFEFRVNNPNKEENR
jgi:dTDP-4-dehydrorhamnose 3,5-epimerase